MNRRDTLFALVALGAAAGPSLALAQSARPPRLIATLDDSPQNVRAGDWAAFRKRLEQLGYAHGSGFVLEPRWANAQAAQLPALAAELVTLKPDVIVTASIVATLAAKRSTSQIPIVSISAGDPVATGLVTSLAKPGGNITGISIVSAEVLGKWLELLREILPRAKSIAFLTYTDNPGSMQLYRELQKQAKPLGVELQVLDGSNARNVELAFDTMTRKRVDACFVSASGVVANQRRQIVEAAAHKRIPAVYARREYVDAGGLMYYGADYSALFPIAADYVHRILQGAKPSEMPFQRATVFKLVVNANAAKALALKIPESVRVRVDEVIQ